MCYTENALTTLSCLCSRSRVGTSELKGLKGNSPTEGKQDMGSIALLSPVRADGRLTQQLGAAKVNDSLIACIVVIPKAIYLQSTLCR